MSQVLTLRDIVSRDEFRISVLAGHRGLDRRVDSVHYADVVDPTSILGEGALIVTSGSQLTGSEQEQREYVERLAEAGVVGLGFGLGPAHDAVPAALVEAAEERDLPLFVLPRSAPFVALSKFVHEASVAARFERDMILLRAHKTLTAAAVRNDGHRSLVDRLAQLIGGTIALYDRAGEFLIGAPVGAPRYSVEIASHISRLRSGKLPGAMSFEADGTQFLLQSIGSAKTLNGFLLGGVPRPISTTDKVTIGVAASLLTVSFGSSNAGAQLEKRIAKAVWAMLRGGQIQAARETAAAMQIPLPLEPLELVMIVGNASDRAEVANSLTRDPAERVLAVESGDRLLVLCSAGSDMETRLQDAIRAFRGITAGYSDPCGYRDLDDAFTQARVALDHAVHRKVGAERFGAIGARGLSELLDRERAQTWARSRLAPVIEHDASHRGDLLRSLRAWLAHNGQWDPAANALQIHRHTLRQRMTRVENLLEISLDSMTNRAELWLALTMMPEQPDPEA